MSNAPYVLLGIVIGLPISMFLRRYFWPEAPDQALRSVIDRYAWTRAQELHTEYTSDPNSLFNPKLLDLAATCADDVCNNVASHVRNCAQAGLRTSQVSYYPGGWDTLLRLIAQKLRSLGYQATVGENEHYIAIHISWEE